MICLNTVSKKLLCWVIFLVPFITQAQTDSTSMKHKMHSAIGLSAGSGAIAGVDVAMSLTKRISVRLGYNYLDYRIENMLQYVKGISFLDPVKGKVAVPIEISQSNVALLADFGLNKRGSLRATIGANYAFKNAYSANVSYTSSESYGDITITPNDIGYINAKISTKSKINPYIGIGFGSIVPRKRIGLSLDLGTYYRGSPVVTIDATQSLRGNKQNEGPLTQNLAPYKWYPIGTLRLAFKFN
jgi:hypothetical protein